MPLGIPDIPIATAPQNQSANVKMTGRETLRFTILFNQGRPARAPLTG